MIYVALNLIVQPEIDKFVKLMAVKFIKSLLLSQDVNLFKDLREKDFMPPLVNFI